MKQVSLMLVVLFLGIQACGGGGSSSTQPPPDEHVRSDLPARDSAWTFAQADSYTGSATASSSFQVVARTAWSINASEGDSNYVAPAPDDSAFDSMSSIDTIVFHHDAQTEELFNGAIESFEGRQNAVAQIYRSHIARGFADIGYHFGILPNGSVWEFRPLERKELVSGAVAFNMGAHVESFNTGTIGVVLIGNFQPYDADQNPLGWLTGAEAEYLRQPTPGQATAMVDLVTYLMSKYPSINKVRTHGQGAVNVAINPGVTLCPGIGTVHLVESLKTRFSAF